MNDKKRKLAAILFADIVGYTALMQRDEQTASALLRNFQQQLETKVAAHNGRIVNFYGDGALCTFQIPVDAVRCAMALQTIFQTAPNVPVRIGIHSGTVTYEGDKIFGNSVNITSRIESMGVAGGILLSKKVRDEVKNNPDLKMQSLGNFKFKNVEEPMAVFALANDGFVVPTKAQLKSHVPTTSFSFLKWFVPMLLTAALLAGLAYWFSSDSNKGQLLELEKYNFEPTETPLPNKLIRQRVAILPIKNQTNQPDLDILGTMAADWITRGLMEIENAEVVSPNTVAQNLNAIGILPNNPNNSPSFSELTGAQNYIQGNFYKEGETLLFLMQLVDAIGGKVQYNFPEVRGVISQRETIITKLREMIAGYWAAQDLVNQQKIKAPKYEAYKRYIEFTHGIGNSLQKMEEILTIDSTFYLARLRNLNDERAESGQTVHFEFLERHYENLSQYEKSWYNYLRAFYLGQPLKAFNYLNELRKKYPKDFSVNHECAGLADEGLNNAQLSMDIYNQMKVNIAQPTQGGILYNWRVYHEMFNRYNLKDLTDFKNYYDNVKPNKAANPGPYYGAKLLGAALLGLEEDVQEILDSERPTAGWHASMAGYSKIWTKKQREQLFTSAIKEITTNYSKPETYEYVVEVFQGKTPTINFESLKKLRVNHELRNLHWSALAFLDKKELAQLPDLIARLKELSIPSLDVSAVFGAAYANYILGVVYTKQGDLDLGMQYLKTSRAHGFHTYVWNYQFDTHLTSLYDLPEFQELIQPIWPEVKD